jgi:hypothetical protein
MTYPHPLLEDPARLASYHEWSEAVYRDLLDCQRGRMSEATFRAKHVERLAILVLDITGFTLAAIREGELQALLRILDVLLTESVHAAVCHRLDCDFRHRARDNLGFAYYLAEPRSGGMGT